MQLASQENEANYQCLVIRRYPAIANINSHTQDIDDVPTEVNSEMVTDEDNATNNEDNATNDEDNATVTNDDTSSVLSEDMETASPVSISDLID